MKTLFNITTSEDDLERFESSADFEELLKSFDGVELMCYGEDQKEIINPKHVVGLHMHFFPFWLDFWNGNEEALIREFDHKENWEYFYGGTDRNALLQAFKKDLKDARLYGAEYVVFHVSEASVEESFTWNYQHTHEEVVDAAAELLNQLFCEEKGELLLLVENLWQPGLTMTEPKITKRLLDKIKYQNKGIMLDTGHLMHTNTALKSQEEALLYIHEVLDCHGELCRWIKGIHLNQSLTGAYSEQMRKNPPKMKNTYKERSEQMFFHAFAVDKHEPFLCSGVRELVDRISPEYLTFEFITSDSVQHRRYLCSQLKALGMETEVFNEIRFGY